MLRENQSLGKQQFGSCRKEQGSLQSTATAEMWTEGDGGQFDPVLEEQAAEGRALDAQQRMSLSDNGLRFIECHEAVACKPSLAVYDASRDKHLGDWTVGYGHKTTKNAFPDGITTAQAADLLKADVQKAVAAVNGALKRSSPSQTQFDAMVSLAFNIGGSAFRNSTLVQRWNSGGGVEQEDLFTRWNKTGREFSLGLYARRKDEYRLFSKGAYQ